MALGANSYGDTGEIAALVPRYTDATTKLFDATTTPTLITIEQYTDQVSGIVNSYLAQDGFDIPVSQADAKLALDMFVNQEMASLAEGINGSGRFGPTARAQGRGGGRFAVIMSDAKAFVDGNKTGFVNLGVARSKDTTSYIGYRDSDNAGTATYPLFQRDGFLGANSFVDSDPE